MGRNIFFEMFHIFIIFFERFTEFLKLKIKKKKKGVPVVVQPLTNLTSIHEDAGLISGLVQWVKDPELP